MPSPPELLEARRMRALESYRILDTPPEDAFDDLTKLAAQICETPISLVTFVDKTRQWFKSRVGLEATETAREIAFCDHAIAGRELFVVEDSLEDPRFATNPLVVGAPHIRFYAGAPLTDSENHNLGTLCVIGREPRRISPTQVAALEALARQVVLLLKLRRVGTQLDAALKEARVLRSIVSTCSYCHKVKGSDGAWDDFESFLSREAGVDVSHGVCPGCLRTHFPGARADKD